MGKGTKEERGRGNEDRDEGREVRRHGAEVAQRCYHFSFVMF
jgi:hypothetical protein